MRCDVSANPVMARLWMGAATVLFCGTEPAAAHVGERGLVMLLPTGYYQLGGALAVVASFLALTVVPPRWLRAWSKVRLPLFAWRPGPRNAISLMAFLFLAGLVFIGRFGTPDPLENLLPLTIWSVWWVAFTLLVALTGNLWPWLNPLSGPLALLRRMTSSSLGRVPLSRLPQSLGYGPAILLFLAFAWYELVSLSPQDPSKLATAVGIYWLLTFVAMVIFGQGAWSRRCEPFSVFFRLIGMLAPFSIISGKSPGRRRIALTFPGVRCLGAGILPLSGTLFVLLTLASVSFDGFSATFTWLGFLSINPLEFPGRSAVTGANTLGLIAAFGIFASLFFLSVFLGNLLTAERGWQALTHNSGVLVYSIIPISIAFHASHYLTVLMVNGQYFAAALSDPLSLGWNLFGTADLHVTDSFLNTMEGVQAIWTAQTAIIVTGHVIGILLAHMIALRQLGTASLATKSQIFLAAAMVFYTVFGLWLLSTPVT
ncbi:hypothetical protein [Pararhizobium sp.]|uniref:hypothetical protein n=1 Tax=Pararhizobium sp. TaxID=1977563 RepID=UPI002723DD2E|nr:hypothetical protein [Pararhizobium sp.]MDO9416144.1 hypothetical protein [Pararhizobium sp.]